MRPRHPAAERVSAEGTAPDPWYRTELVRDARGISLPDALAEVVERVPDRTAIIDPDRSVSYRELLDDVHRVAAAVPPTDDPTEEPVVVTAGHGITPLVQILAVLQAGRIVLPVDVREPRARLAEIYRSAGATAVLTSDGMRGVAHDVAGDDPVVTYEEVGTAPVRATAAPRAEDRATIFYTSGSTGTPKGVFDDHHCLVHHNTSFAWTHRLTAEDRVALTSSYAFAAMRTSFFAVLLSGGTVCTYDLAKRGVRGIPEFVDDLGVSVIFFTPTVLRALHDVSSTGPMHSVRLVTLGGETLFGRDVRLARPRFAPTTIFRTRLSSSEALGLAAYEIPDDVDDGPVPAGTAEPWAEVHIVDDRGEPVARGDTGRLEVVSPHCALGYWRDPELTAARFFRVPDGRRGFRTSDAARWRPDGLLEHCGRLDDRVKVRGAMVSPSEVETALTSLPEVAVAAVVAEVGERGDTRLVGYVEPERGAAPSAWALRRALRELVPTHMVPSSLVMLDAIPRTPRGKLDRAALEPPPAPRTPYRKPWGIEQPLAELFAETLGLDDIGADADFFEYGGDSLAAIELLAAIDERFGVDLRDRDLLDAPTVAALAPRLVRRRPAGSTAMITIREALVPGRVPFCCVTGGGDPASSFASLARALDDRTMHVFQARGLEERAWPDRTVGDAARRYVRELRARRRHGPYLLGGYSFGGLVAFEMACRLEAEGEQVALLVVLDTAAPGARPDERSADVTVRLRAGTEQARATGRVAVARRVARLAVTSANAHARRELALARAVVAPRDAVEQSRLFYELSRRVARRYRPTARFAGPTLIVRARDRPDDLPPDLGWGAHVTGPVECAETPGWHVTIHRNPNVRVLGDLLTDAFARHS